MHQEPMTLRVRMAESLDNVRSAVFSADATQAWLAEHVAVELPHRFEFWGRYTPEGTQPQQELLHSDEQSIRFSWLLGGKNTMVEMSWVEESSHSTIVTLRQTDVPSWEEIVREEGTLSVLHTFWAHALANLTDYLQGRPPTPKCDFTSPVLATEVTIFSSAAEVFDALVDKGKFATWFGANIDIEPWVGGRWAMGGFELDSEPATITEFTQNRAMTLTWPEYVSAWKLTEEQGKTRLRLTVSGFDVAAPPYASWLGWLSGIAELRRFLEPGTWPLIWLDVDAPGMPDGMVITHS